MSDYIAGRHKNSSWIFKNFPHQKLQDANPPSPPGPPSFFFNSRHTFLCCSVVGGFVEAICQPVGKASFNESALSLWQFLCSGVGLSAACWAYKSHWWHIWGTLGIIPPFLTCDLIPLSAIAATHELRPRLHWHGGADWEENEEMTS